MEKVNFLAVTIVFAPVEKVKEAVDRQLFLWWKSVNENENLTERHPFDLEKSVNPKPKKVSLFEVEAQEPAVLIEANLEDGYSSLTHMVSSAMPAYRFVIIRSSAGAKDEWPIQEFVLMQGKKTIRSLRVMKDTSGWEYWEEGKLQSFEEPELYEARVKKERLTREMIVRYTDRLSVNLEAIANGDGYRSVAFYAEGI
ncbi:MAG: hypothetical protein AAGL18_10775 [Pseudomonadota bacterium]